MKSTTWIEISRSALANNIAFIKDLCGSNAIFSSVVKGNAYGHGIEVFCPLAYDLGLRHFSTFSAFEAHQVLKSIESKAISIMIMGHISDDQIAWAIQNDIEFFVFNDNRLEKTLQIAKKIGKKALIHLEFETGMNRTGFIHAELKYLIEKCHQSHAHISLKGICTHLAGAESVANYKRIQDQLKAFKKIKNAVDKHTDIQVLYHVACSAATLRYSKNIFDLARVGILQYGFFPNKETLIFYLTQKKTHDNPLKRVISWKTRIMDIKEVKIGEFIGYGTSYFTNNDTRIALIPVGYSGGFSRSLSNQGKVIIRGVRLDVIGTVNMNMMAVDISPLDHAEIGDEVVLIGKQGNQEITVSSFSEFSQQLNYELLTRLPNDIERIITQ